MNAKAFEVRDRMTFIPVVAIEMRPDQEPEAYLLRRSGFVTVCPGILLVKMLADGSPSQASSDPFGWGSARTLPVAHRYIIRHWNNLETGAVIDVEFILGETEQPKPSERESTCI